MKYVKLAVIFAIILCIVYFSMSIGGDGTSDIKVSTSSNFSDLTAQISDEWKNASQWDEKVYSELNEEIIRSESNGVIDAHQKMDLLLQNRTAALDKVYQTCDAEYRKPECDGRKLDANMNGLSMIVMDDLGLESLEKEQAVVNLNTWYSTYKRIKNFIQTATKQPGVNLSRTGYGHQHKWYDINRHTEKIISQRDDFRRDPVYQEKLKNIAELTRGLNDIDDLMSSMKESFCNRLANELIQYYNDIPEEDRTDGVRDDFDSDCQSYRGLFRNVYKPGCDRLTNSLRNYYIPDNR